MQHHESKKERRDGAKKEKDLGIKGGEAARGLRAGAKVVVYAKGKYR